MPDLPPPAFARKIITDWQLLRHACRGRRPLVFTNGCFDLLHRGHVTYLDRAKALGATLVVGLNTDASVRRLNKGPARPINALEDRMAVVAALESVDFVTAFEEDTPAALIQALEPDVLAKGGDWPVARMVGADFVLARGGKIHSIPFEHRRSTTAVIQRIRETTDGNS